MIPVFPIILRILSYAQFIIYPGMSSNYLIPLDFQMILQVRKYTPFIVVEANGDKLAGSTGFNDVTGWVSFRIQLSGVIVLLLS